MIRDWKTLGLAAVLAASLLIPAPVAADQNSDSGARPPDTATQLRQIQDSLAAMQHKLDVDLNVIRQNQLTTDMKADDAMRRMLAMEQQLADMRREMAALRQRPGTVTSTSAYGPNGTAPVTGRVMLINDYPTEQAVMVNGVSYHLAPGQNRTVTIPAGTFTYEVLGIQQAPRQRSVVANGTFTVTLFPVEG
ncbi:MAG TPA: hypothetical protein VFA18_00790 [Gemmataceae bacterium]|nr:hypothetical protein [Gemmataceae bacterium]